MDELDQIAPYEEVNSTLNKNSTPAQIKAARAKIAAKELAGETIGKANETKIGTASSTVDDRRDERIQQLELEKAKRNEPTEGQMPAMPKHERDRSFMIKATILTALSIAGAAYMQQGAEGAASLLTGALNGLMAGDTDRYNRELTRYHDSIKAIHAEYDRREKVYNNFLKNKDREISQTFAEYRLMRMSYGDMRAQNVKSLSELHKLAENDRKAIDKLEKSNLDIERLAHQDHRATEQKWKDNYIQKHNAELKGKTPAEIDNLAQAEYLKAHPKGTGKKNNILSDLSSETAGGNGDFTIVRK